MYVSVLVAHSCLTLCDPIGCSPPGSSVHGILHARTLEWVENPFSRGSSWPRDWTWVSHITDRFFTIWVTRETSYPLYLYSNHWWNRTNPGVAAAAAAAKSLQLCPTLCDPIDGSPRGSRPWYSPGKNTGVGCHFLLQCKKVKSESEVAQSCPTLSDPMDCSPRGSSVHGNFQAGVGCLPLLNRYFL